jgi:hypothetical protein
MSWWTIVVRKPRSARALSRRVANATERCRPWLHTTPMVNSSANGPPGGRGLVGGGQTFRVGWAGGRSFGGLAADRNAPRVSGTVGW